MDKLESTFHKTQNNNHNTIKARRKWPRNGKWRTANGNCSSSSTSNYNNNSNLSISLWANFKIIAHSRRRKLSAMMCIICNLYRHTHTCRDPQVGCSRGQRGAVSFDGDCVQLFILCVPHATPIWILCQASLTRSSRLLLLLLLFWLLFSFAHTHTHTHICIEICMCAAAAWLLN